MRRRRLTVEEMEEAAKIKRTEPRAYTLNDAAKLEREMLGKSWGKPRRKLEGWPR